MSETASPDFLAILETLTRHKVDFIVVGGVAAVLQGAPMNTFDLDVVHSRAPENVTRLLQALEELDAWPRSQPGRRLRPDASHLASPGYQLLLTRYGPFDLLGMIGSGHDYPDLLKCAGMMDVAAGLPVRVLDLEALIRVKEETAGDKDRASLALLRRTLKERLNG